MPKPPFRPKVAGRIGFWFGIFAGALVSVISLRRMGNPEKAKKVIWITLLTATVAATVLIVIPDALGRLVGLGMEVVWYIVFPKIQDQEFGQWQATHNDVAPSNGWKALGWGFLGLALFFVIIVVMEMLLSAMGIAPL
jgi:hypothetical protein